MVENYVSGIYFYASGKRQPILCERYDLTTYFDTFMLALWRDGL